MPSNDNSGKTLSQTFPGPVVGDGELDRSQTVGRIAEGVTSRLPRQKYQHLYLKSKNKIGIL